MGPADSKEQNFPSSLKGVGNENYRIPKLPNKCFYNQGLESSSTLPRLSKNC